MGSPSAQSGSGGAGGVPIGGITGINTHGGGAANEIRSCGIGPPWPGGGRKPCPGGSGLPGTPAFTPGPGMGV